MSSVHRMIQKTDKIQRGKGGASATLKERVEDLPFAGAWLLLLATFFFFWDAVVKSLKWDVVTKIESEIGNKIASTTAEQHQGIGISELRLRWNGVVEALKRDGVTVTNPDHALEGAISIR